MKLFLKKICLTAWLVLSVTSCGYEPVKRYQSVDTAMGTVVKTTIYGTKEAENLNGRIRQEIVDLEDEVLSWRKEASQIGRINACSGSENGTALEPFLMEILEKVLQVSNASGGALDITMGQVVRLWNIDTYAGAMASEYTLPKREEIAAGMEHTGWEKIQLTDGKIFLPLQLTLDLGAVGKGVACDHLADVLAEAQGVKGAVISVGGSILTYGTKPDGSAWNIGITDPLESSDYLGSVRLSGQWCMSTSGDYERYVEIDGVRYHHILDPATGYPADSGLSSVTVLTKDGCLSDALSTACFVLGETEGLALLEQFDAEAVLVRKDGKIILTDGMEQIFTEH